MSHSMPRPILFLHCLITQKKGVWSAYRHFIIHIYVSFAYYRVMVLDAGRIAEFDNPQTLIENKSSIFYGMAKDAGLVKDAKESTA